MLAVDSFGNGTWESYVGYFILPRAKYLVLLTTKKLLIRSLICAIEMNIWKPWYAGSFKLTSFLSSSFDILEISKQQRGGKWHLGTQVMPRKAPGKCLLPLSTTPPYHSSKHTAFLSWHEEAFDCWPTFEKLLHLQVFCLFRTHFATFAYLFV